MELRWIPMLIYVFACSNKIKEQVGLSLTQRLEVHIIFTIREFINEN